MSYFLEDVDRAERRIMNAGLVPTPRMERFDYGFALYVEIGDKRWTIFRPKRWERDDETEIAVTPAELDMLIKEWKAL